MRPGRASTSTVNHEQFLNRDACFARAADHGVELVGGYGAGEGADVQSRRRRNDLEMAGELSGQSFGDHLVPHSVSGAHLSDVARQSTAIDEAREGGLSGHRRVPVGHVLGRLHGHAQTGRGYKETQPQGWQHGLGERSHVDDAARWSLTKVPDPTRDVTKPSPESRSYPTVTVVRDTLSVRANSRLGGRGSPGRSRPSRMASRNCRYISPLKIFALDQADVELHRVNLQRLVCSYRQELALVLDLLSS
jgi:hypothetical protein